MADDEFPPKVDVDQVPVDQQQQFMDDRIVQFVSKPERERQANAEKYAHEALDHPNLLINAIAGMPLPPRDWLLNDFLSTTSKVMVVGQTGIGKTLFALDLAAAVASGGRMLDWVAPTRRRVMYLDGELAIETMKERAESVRAIYGDEMDLWIFNRDILKHQHMPPLNQEQGQAWLKRTIDTLKPDLIVFDNIMSLTLLDLKKAEEWQPVQEMIRWLSSQRICQIWLHHTGYDTTRSYGDSTKEWELDTSIILSKPSDTEEEDESKVELRFTKARLRTPHNRKLYADQVIKRYPTGWGTLGKPPPKRRTKSGDLPDMKGFILKCLDILSENSALDSGLAGELVRKVGVTRLQQLMVQRGYLNCNDGSVTRVTDADTQLFYRAKRALQKEEKVCIDNGFIWRLSKTAIV